MVEFHQRLDLDFAVDRTTVRPGCTGLWQIGAACTGLLGDAPEYDRFYLRHQSLRLDAWILWRTTLMMLGIGALVRLEDVPEFARRGIADAAVAGAPLRELELADV